MSTVTDPKLWAAVPPAFWGVAFFLFGTVVGSFLNVCIHRMPRGMSIVSPPSHCPACGYSIPWYLNIPLLTWLYLRGRCAHCQSRISVRYFLVELLTGGAFLGAWLAGTPDSIWLALIYCLFFSGLILATFIDYEHYIIPDEITLGGMVAGFLCSFAVPGLHGVSSAALALKESFLGIVVGAGLVYAVVRLGKLAFGRQKLELAPDTKVVFTETALVLPDSQVPYEELFYRKTDAIRLMAKRVELVDRCYQNVRIELTPLQLRIADEILDPEQTPYMEVITEKMILPREAMGLGDVKFMGGIGAFLGWKAVVFSLMVSSIIGAVVGVTLIITGKKEWSGRLPYGPYIALAAAIWIAGGHRWWQWVFANPEMIGGQF